MKNTYVMALGGSIMHPDEINVEYIKEFFTFICGQIEEGKKFIIIVGGGAMCRRFNRAAEKIGGVTDEDKDWLGIHATRMNAQLMRTVFKNQAHPVVLDGRKRLKDFEGHQVIIGAGWHPGWSTDFVAVQTAVDFGAQEVLILGKPDYVYDKDNCEFIDAKPFKKLTWDEYLELIPNEWSPGGHAPVDPVAAKLAKAEKMKVIVAGGADLANVKNILEGEKFKGTVIN